MALSLIATCVAGQPRMGCTFISCPFIISCGAMGLKSVKYDDIDKLKVDIFISLDVNYTIDNLEII